MSISNKLNALLMVSGRTKADLAQYFGISRQSMANKFQRGYFSADDLIHICYATGAELCIHAQDGQIIKLTPEDLSKKDGPDA